MRQLNTELAEGRQQARWRQRGTRFMQREQGTQGRSVSGWLHLQWNDYPKLLPSVLLWQSNCTQLKHTFWRADSPAFSKSPLPLTSDVSSISLTAVGTHC